MIESFSYETRGATPKGYECAVCGAIDCKLWREAHGTGLKCISCLAQYAGAKKLRLDWAGRISCPSERRHEARHNTGPGRRFARRVWEMRCDQMAYHVPAIPTPNGMHFWGYTSVPPSGIYWWQNLPNNQPLDKR